MRLLKSFLAFFLFHFLTCHAMAVENDFDKLIQENEPKIVLSAKKLTFLPYQEAFNPSILKTDEGFLLTFRHLPDPLNLWISHIYIVKLSEDFMPISKPQILDTRSHLNMGIPSQSEDARLFSYQGNVYIVYNDNEEQINPSLSQRRDMFIAQVKEENGKFFLTKPLKLQHLLHYGAQNWQKNWSPFEYNNALLFTYSQVPYEVIHSDLNTGLCTEIEKQDCKIEWPFGELRGGTPALLVDGEYLAFFHSQILTQSPVSKKMKKHHYYIGAYTFTSEPPFHLTRVTSSPIIGKNFYTDSDADKRVVFPGGFTVAGPYIFLAYGKDDREIWIAVIDKKRLFSFLKTVR